MEIDQLKNYYEENSDLDFEMKIRQAMFKRGYMVKHSGRYVDEFTGKMREYDLLATPNEKVIDGMTKSMAFRYLELIVECKNISEDCPLIVGVRPIEYEMCNSMDIIRSHSVELSGYIRSVPISEMASFYNSYGGNFGKNIGIEVMQVARVGIDRRLKAPDPNSGLYDKWTQAVNHAIYRYHNIADEISTGGTNGTMAVWCQPILVIPNNRLYIAERINENVSIKPTLGVNVKVDIRSHLKSSSEAVRHMQIES